MELTKTIETRINGLIHNYKEIDLYFDDSTNALWFYMRGNTRPTFTTSLIQELSHLYKTIKNKQFDFGTIDYVVGASLVPGVFNLGGDLEHFRRCVELQDREALTVYAHSCVDLGYENNRNFGHDITSIALLQGSAYGGGFEAALSSNIIVAEKGVKIGFPEILFNLFPGMGAYTYLARRVEPHFAETMITSGQTYTSDELFEHGVIDILAEPGEGTKELEYYIKKHRNQRNGHIAMQKARLRTFPVSHEELRDISDIWVDAALGLSNRDLKIMDRLVNRQTRLSMKTKISSVA